MTDVSIKTMNSNSKRGGERAFQIWGGGGWRSEAKTETNSTNLLMLLPLGKQSRGPNSAG